MLRVKDIAAIAKIRPVINLADTDLRPDEIVDTFKFSEDIDGIFDDILKKIDNGQGSGFFLKGGRGSGKSHLESYLELMFRRKLPPLDKYARAKDLNLNIVRISLLSFPSSRSLESILQSSLGDMSPIHNRDDYYSKHFSVPTMLIIDEASDFLASKSNEHEFYEDVRALQYLGEYTDNKPLWIIAALQQSIEETGHIDAEIMARLKDRYVPLKLTVSHIEDLIDKRVVLKNDKAEDAISSAFRSLKKNYPNITIKYEEFRKTYPLHPATADFLTGLESIYSGSRGILQFVSAEAQATLDMKADDLDTLITPDAIFDHFEDRIRESKDYSKYATVVYDYYKRHIRDILQKPAHQAAGLAAIKVLILTEISPTEKRKKADDIAEILGKQMSTLSPLINYQMIQELVLDPIASHQMFVKKEGFEYFIDPKIDEGGKVRAKIKTQREGLSDRRFLLDQLCGMVNTPQLPLHDISDGKLISFTWQNSIRQCSAYVFKGESFKKTDMEKALAGVNVHFDGRLLLFSPFFEDKKFYQPIKETFQMENLPLVIFWIPREMTDAELLFVESHVSKKLLLEEFPNLSAELKKEEQGFIATITKLYFEGEMVTAAGSKFDLMSGAVSGLQFDRVIAQPFEDSLSRIHPKHQSIVPRGAVSYISTDQLSSIYSNFIKPGKINTEDADKRGIDIYINGLLKPMGVVKSKGGTIYLTIGDESELVPFMLGLISMDDNIYSLRSEMKKGDWGLSDTQFTLLTASLIGLGQLTAYRDDEPVELKDITALVRGEINRVKSGKGISPELCSYIQYGRFIWGDVGDMPTPLTQRSMWESAKDFIRETRKLISDLREFVHKYDGSPVLKKVRLDTTLIKRISMFLDSITLTLPAPDGIERFLVYFKDNHEAEVDCGYLKKLFKLFSEQFDTLSRCYSYLSDPAIRHIDHVPGAETLKGQKDALLVSLDDYFNSLEGFEALKSEWGAFYDQFTDAYATGHDAYYESDAFILKKSIDDSNESKSLKRISLAVKAVTFDGDWFQLQPEFNQLPEKCRSDVRAILFQRPQCHCGYKLGSIPPEPYKDLRQQCKKGIVNFVRFLHGNRASLEAYILSITDPAVSKNLSKVMALNTEKVSASTVMPMLTDEVLVEINKAFSNGGWIVKDVNVDDFVKLVRGRRFRQEELKNIFHNWMGPDEQAIIHVKDKNPSLASTFKDSLAKYGVQGERLSLDIEKELLERSHLTLEDFQEGRASLPVLERLRFEEYSKEQLLKLLEQEDISFLKQRIRTDIFHRAWGKPISEETLRMVADPAVRDILSICAIHFNEARYHGIEKFSKAIAPLNFLSHKIKSDNANRMVVEDAVVDQISHDLDEMEKAYNKSSGKFQGAYDEAYLTQALTGVVIVLDGLRYDLWIMLRGIMLSEGWTIKQDIPYVLPTPTTTSNFRQIIGVGDNTEGHIGDKRFALLKWAEKDAGQRETKRFLKGGEDIKILHFNFIDTKIHASTLDLYPLYTIIKGEFISGILPVLKDTKQFALVSDHGFAMSKKMKDRYSHGADSIWERVLPFALVTVG